MAEDPWEKLLSFQSFQSKLPSGAAYGYGGQNLQRLWQREFPRLGEITYLDHAGATLYPESLLKAFTDDLKRNVYGNPHSQNISSKLTYDTIEHVRFRILQHFNTTIEDYTVIFTSGSTASFKLIAEAFPWMPENVGESGSRFCYLTDNHTSVVGMRVITTAKNVPFVPVKPKDMLSEENIMERKDNNCSTPHLFCYPAQSNFSGVKYPLAWIEEIQCGKLSPIQIKGKWFVLLDAASYASTSPLDLSIHQADFIPISFYKIFGFPTGIGALLVKNEIASCLRKTFFGGGTAAAYLAEEDFYSPRQSVAERFEDGTISFLDIIAVKHGFDVLEKITGGMENIKQHTFALAHHTYSVLSTLKYANGAPLVRIYTDTDFSNSDIQGPIINFNVLDENGDIIGYSQVDKLAGLYNIHMRTGCFCNTGACQQHLGINHDDIKKNLQAGHVCGDDIDVIDGHPTGSVRISFGYMSTFEDVQAFLKFIISIRLSTFNLVKCPLQTEIVPKITSFPRWNSNSHDKKNATEEHLERIIKNLQLSHHYASVIPEGNVHLTKSWAEINIPKVFTNSVEVPNGKNTITITNIYLYPIKSCAAFEAMQWPIGNQGLLYDRNWMVTNQNGVCITQKQEPRLCLIQPLIDLEQNVMIIKAEGMNPISVSLEEHVTEICQSKVCSHRVQTYDCGERLADWFTKFLGRQCRLIRQSSDFKRNSSKENKKGETPAVFPSLSLVNEAQYLLINMTSILQLREQVTASLGESFLPQELIYRFRANIVIRTNEPFEEDLWDQIAIGPLHFRVLGPCHRCLVICINQQTGQRNKEFLQGLSSIRDRKTNFGIYLANHSETQISLSNTLSVGSEILVSKNTTSSASNEENKSV
ncbi:PREDICTED: molybdenum cofactor sulfurase [Thamnophis sirtalis]|uniref:Molybdenum cofactor sulfurase n=1 Tax=Thamnophis sirtalis TaxID=35019 RepID=A0A6I9XSN6_9SAUR|nr:PREDICTED: molybdenum cofactor sulfurase [Thamnophis sirtalis]